MQFVTYIDILHEKISDLSLLFSIILFIIDELVKGINIREVVVRMRSSLHVRQQTIAHGQCFGVGGCFRHWDGFIVLFKYEGIAIIQTMAPTLESETVKC